MQGRCLNSHLNFPMYTQSLFSKIDSPRFLDHTQIVYELLKHTVSKQAFFFFTGSTSDQKANVHSHYANNKKPREYLWCFFLLPHYRKVWQSCGKWISIYQTGSRFNWTLLGGSLIPWLQCHTASLLFWTPASSLWIWEARKSISIWFIQKKQQPSFTNSIMHQTQHSEITTDFNICIGIIHCSNSAGSTSSLEKASFFLQSVTRYFSIMLFYYKLCKSAVLHG